MKKAFVIILLLIGGVTNAQFKRVATAGFTFLEIPVSARSSAMGEVGLTLSNAGAQALFTNPALLGFSKGNHSIYFSFGNYLVETQQQAAAYAINLGEFGIAGISIYRLDAGSMVRTVNADPNNPGAGYRVTGSFNAADIAIGLSYARKLTDHFAFGGTIKYVEENIAEFKAANEVLDFGMIYFTGFRSLRIAGGIQNLGVDARFSGALSNGGTLEGDNFSMPVCLKLSAAMEVIGTYDSPTRLTLAVEGLHPSDYPERVNVGTEFWYKDLFAIRGGYKFNYDEEGLTAGIGLNGKPFGYPDEFDVSYTDYGRLGYVVRFSLSLRF